MTSSCLIWNCSGLVVPLIVHVFRDMIPLKLSETRCSISYIDTLKAQTHKQWLVVEREGMSGGMVLLWRKDVKVSILSYSNHHIDSEVLLPGETNKWRFAGFYGIPKQHLWHWSWDLLRQLSTHSSLPSLVGRDFNQILSNTKEGGWYAPGSSYDGGILGWFIRLWLHGPWIFGHAFYLVWPTSGATYDQV